MRDCSNFSFATALTHTQPNILVDGSGHARIADFGVAKVTQNLDSVQSASVQHGYTARCAAPEVLNGETHNKEVDIFAFAMVMVEVRYGRSIVCRSLAYCHFVSVQLFTGTTAFSGYPSIKAMLAIVQGSRPPRPTYPTFTEDLWMLMQRCWDHEPHLRPDASEVMRILTPSVSDLFW